MDCIFCEFVSGKRKIHRSGYPFIAINETQNTISFMAIDIPATEDGHLLVIPKFHYRYIGDLPKSVLHELIEHVSVVSKALRKTHQGCNILLNEGKSAGQIVLHAHFHIIPRDEGDNIKIELWKRKKMSKSEFRRLNNRIKKLIKSSAN